MTRSELIEGNTLICDFLEWKSDKSLIYKCPNLFPFQGYESGYTEFTVTNIGFEKDWNMLMPVIEKISRIRIDWEDPEYNDTYYPRTFGMLSPSGNPMVRFNATPVFEAETLIEAAWMGVVDFIKTYKS